MMLIVGFHLTHSNRKTIVRDLDKDDVYEDIKICLASSKCTFSTFLADGISKLHTS